MMNENFNKIILQGEYKSCHIVWYHKDAEVFLVRFGNTLELYGTRGIGYQEILLLDTYSSKSVRYVENDIILKIIDRLSSIEYRSLQRINLSKAIRGE